jgi:hypothetical protein
VRVSCGSEEAKSSSSGRRCEQRWEFLATGKLVINVAALLNSAPVGKLKFLFLIRLRGGFIRLVILSSEEQIERFLEFSRYVVLDLGVRAPPLGPADAAAVPFEFACSPLPFEPLATARSGDGNKPA